MNKWHEFCIHNRVTIRVAEDAPTASLFLDLFQPFITRGLNHFDLTVTGNSEPFRNGAYGEVHGETDFYYTDQGVQIESNGVQIFFDGASFRLTGRVELLVMAIPLIDRLMVMKGAAMIHALTVDFEGRGVCMPAWGGSGKTSTMAKLVKINGFSFMGDDWAFLTDRGLLLGYAKPMFIKPYHRPIYPHLFQNGHKPLVPVRLSKAIARLTTRVHPLITKYPRLARITRRWSPEHMMVTPQRAFPQANFTMQAPLAAAIFVERNHTEKASPEFKEMDPSWMVSRFIGNFYSELPRPSRVVVTALAAAGLVPLEQSIYEKANVLRKALGEIPVFLLRVPQQKSPDEASDDIVQSIQQILGAAGGI
jgi:hypothetical protein